MTEKIREIYENKNHFRQPLINLSGKLAGPLGRLQKLPGRVLKVIRFSKTRRVGMFFIGMLIIIIPIFLFIIKNPKLTEAGWWLGDGGGAWQKRKALTITNDSTEDLAANTTIAVTVNTKELVNTGKLQDNCDDLRVVYQPDSITHTELDRYVSVSGNTDCSDKDSSQVYFNLQAGLNSGTSTSSYYIYYDNSQAPAPSNPDNAFDIGSKDALLVCPFDGSTGCAAGETPSTESGAIRYSGSKSALSFDGDNDYAVTSTSGGIGGLSAFTTEMWVRSDNWDSSSNEDRFAETNGSGGVGGSHMRYLDLNSRFQMDVNIGATWKYFSSGNNTAPSDSGWHHIAVTYDGSTLRWFVDGAQTNSISASGSVGGTEQRVTVGSEEGGSSNNFNGDIDELRISTVARYTSNFTPSTAPFVRDEHTKLLLHFDENGDDPRNTGKVIDDSGNGNDGTITGAKYVAGLVGIDASTSDTGNVSRQSYAGQEGIFIEEATTNKITNPSFDHTTYNTNWDAEGANLTVSEETTAPYYKFGSKSAKIVASGTSDNALTIGIDPNSTSKHALTAYIYNGTSGSVGGTIDNTVAELVWEGSAQPTATYTDEGGGWWRISYIADATDAINEYGLMIEDGKTVYLDGVQLEDKSAVGVGYYTSYADGTLGSNYSWSGTAHDSTSTRTKGILEYSSSGNISTSGGTLSLWFKPNTLPKSAFQSQNLFWWGDAGGDELAIQLIDSSNSLNFTLSTDGGSSRSCGTITQDVDENEWHHAAITYTTAGGGSDGCQVYYDAAYATSGSSSQTWSFGPAGSMGVGVRPDNNANQPQSVISDLRIFDTALTDAEMDDLYQAGLVSHSDSIEVDSFNDDKGQNPVAIWHFDESYGTTASDSSTYSNDLTVSGASWETQSVGGRNQLERNISFDGSDDYLSRSWDRDFNFGTGSFSISGWFRHASSITGTDTILSRYSNAGFKVYMDSNGYICLGIDDDNTSFPEDTACTTASEGSYADSKWHHFEAVKDGTTSISIYIDGKLVTQNSSTTADGTLNDSSTLYIGIDSDGTSNPWDGFLDEMVIYPYARDASQVKEDYQGHQLASVFGTQTKDWLTNGLVGYWPMDDEVTGDSQTVIDISGNTHNGTTTDIDATLDCGSEGKFNYGCHFDGSDDYINVAETSALNITDKLTMSAWVYPTFVPSTSERRIIHRRKSSTRSHYFLARNQDGIVFRVEDCAAAYTQFGSTTIPENAWSHIATTYDDEADTVKIYINGELTDSTNTFTRQICNTAGDVQIGGHSGHTRFWDGNIDEARIYNRVFSPSEVQALYEWAPGPIAYYSLDEGSGTGSNAVKDRSGNNYHGTMDTGMDETNWVNGKFGKALFFDGVDDVQDELVDIYSSGLNDDFNGSEGTVTAWVKVDNAGVWTDSAYRRAVNLTADASNDIYLEKNGNDNQFTFHYRAGGTNSSISKTSFSETGWMHAAITWSASAGSSGEFKAYYNGVLEGTSTSLGAWAGALNTTWTNIGSGSNGGSNAWQGDIDEVRVYNYARTQAQIIEDMNAGHPVGGSPLPSQVGWWKFDEGYGDTANDSSGDGNDGDLQGTCPGGANCPIWTNSGKFGKALSFDGSDDYLTVADPGYFDDIDNMTISFWFNTTDWATGGSDVNIILEKRNGNNAYSFQSKSAASTELEFVLSADTAFKSVTVSSDATAIEGEWHHAAGVYDGVNIYSYLDGELVESTTQTGNIDANVAALSIGGRTDSTPAYHYNGLLDDVKFYNVALTAEQIKADMNQGKSAVWGAISTDGTGPASWSASAEYCVPGDSSTCNSPVGEWKLNEKTSQSTYDTSSNGNTFTLGSTGGGDTNDPTWSHSGKCQKGACLYFDGSDNYSQITSPTNLDVTNITLEAWAKSNVDGTVYTSSGTVINRNMTNNGTYQFFVGSSTDKMTFGIRLEGSEGTSRNVLANNVLDTEWHHYVGTFDGTSQYLYVDGVLQTNTGSTSGTIDLDGPGPLNIGSIAFGSGGYFNGQIDEVKIYDYARTPAQVAWSYNKGGPVGYWKLDECSGTVANDSGSGGNNGTITIGATGDNTSAGTCGGASDEAWANGSSGKINASIDLDGSNDYIALSSGPDISGQYGTISFWLKPDDLSPDVEQHVYANSTTSYFFRTNWAATSFEYSINNRGVNTGSNAIPENIWTHVALTWAEISGAYSRKIYINGRLEVNDTAFFDTPSIVLDYIGSDGTPNKEFNGQLDEFKVYNYELTPEHIKTEYTQGAASFN